MIAPDKIRLTGPSTPFVKPPRLFPGATIGVAALSGSVDPAKLDTGLAHLVARGYRVVEAENADAGIVYRTDASIARSARIAFAVVNGPEILYSVAPVASSKNPQAAAAFVAFLAGPEGRAEFTKRGFVIRGTVQR